MALAKFGCPLHLQTDGFIMEEKLDGERIQLHKRGEEYRYYSRKDKDYTVSFTDVLVNPFELLRSTSMAKVEKKDL